MEIACNVGINRIKPPRSVGIRTMYIELCVIGVVYEVFVFVADAIASMSCKIFEFTSL